MLRRDLTEVVRKAFEGRYAVERELGRGGAARVFLARGADGVPVALKVLHPELQASVTAERFLREVRVLNQIDHPLVTRVLDSGMQDYFVFYVMPFEEGDTLRAALDRSPIMPLPQVLRLARDLLDALGAAHRHEIVHRDVKPENILLAPRGAVLLDFGIARAVEAATPDRLTRSGITVGTSGYMSPEQIQALPLDARSDVYSVGCVLFECLAGRPPFAHRSEHIVLQLHLKEAPPDVRVYRPEVPPGIAAAIGKALLKDREQRWPSAAALRDALLGAAGMELAAAR
ncbi:MAG: serine/threonine-protein kinase [Gemmatimonadales bacterium]|nr:serine/threonine-protein kinase [Gemmatimonadales bacterium]